MKPESVPVAACVVRQLHRLPPTTGCHRSDGYAVLATLRAVRQFTPRARTFVPRRPVFTVPAAPHFLTDARAWACEPARATVAVAAMIVARHIERARRAASMVYSYAVKR